MERPRGAAAPTPAQRIARATLAIALLLLGLWTLHEFLPALIWAGISPSRCGRCIAAPARGFRPGGIIC